MSMHKSYVCDLRQAPDSMADRLDAYARVFASLIAREPRNGSHTGFRFRFAADRVDRALLGELVAREQACCPFLRINLTIADDEVWWDCDVDTPEALPYLQGLYDLPDTAATPRLPGPAGNGHRIPPGVRIRHRTSADPHDDQHPTAEARPQPTEIQGERKDPPCTTRP